MLLYHRVGEAVVDPWALAVSPTHFSEHMEVLRGRTVSLRDMLRSFRAGTLEPDTVAVTFDDGYAETITIARPILERREIPATFYVPTGAINSAREFWWDELERLILIAEHLPERLSIVIGGQQFNWVYPRSQQDRWTDQDRVRARTWQAWEVPAPSPRHELYASLWERCQRLPTADRERVLGELRLWGGALPPRGTHRTLTDREVQDLSSSAIADIGAHTVTHPALATLGSAAQRSEIDMGKRGLEQMIGRSVTRLPIRSAGASTTPRRRSAWCKTPDSRGPVPIFPAPSWKVSIPFNCRGCSCRTGTATSSTAD